MDEQRREVGNRAGLRRVARGHPRWVLACVAAIGFAALVAPIPPQTWPAILIGLAVGAGTVALVATGRPVRATPATVRGRGVRPWVVLAVALATWELSAFLSGSRPEFPTLSTLVSPLLSDPAPRAVGYLVWLGVGYWLLQR